MKEKEFYFAVVDHDDVVPFEGYGDRFIIAVVKKKYWDEHKLMQLDESYPNVFPGDKFSDFGDGDNIYTLVDPKAYDSKDEIISEILSLGNFEYNDELEDSITPVSADEGDWDDEWDDEDNEYKEEEEEEW